MKTTTRRFPPPSSALRWCRGFGCTTKFVLLLCLLFLASSPFPFVGANFNFNFNAFVLPRENPYRVLGIKGRDRFNTDAIKKAYREKAKAAHPDKNRDVDPQRANEQFIRIQEAYDFLADNENKRKYDEHLRNGHRQNRAPTQAMHEERERAKQRVREEAERRFQQEQRDAEERARKIYLQEEAKLIQEQHLLKLSTLEQLRGISDLFDSESQTFKKHFLCVFVGDRKQDSTAVRDYLFPYPFGPNGSNSFDWTEVLQTAKVRYNKQTPLTKIFRVPKRTLKPFIVFAKKGSRLDRGEFEIFHLKKRREGSGEPYEEIEKWVLRQMTTTVSVVNRFDAGGPTLRILFDDGERIRSAGRPIPPGFLVEIPISISGRLIVLDGNTNDFVGKSGILNTDFDSQRDKEVIDKITMDTLTVKEQGQRFEVGRGYGTTRVCYDLAMECVHWATKNNCDKRSEFAHSMCAKSCGVCIESHNWNAIHYVLVHLPLHKIPNIAGSHAIVSYVRSGVKFAKVFLHDVFHLWEMRRNVMFAFSLTGLQLGIQIVLLARMLIGKNTSRIRHYSAYADVTSSSSLISLVLLVLSTSITFGAQFWLSVTSRNEVPKILWDFQTDLRAIEQNSTDMICVLLGFGIISFLLSNLWTQRLRNHFVVRQALLLVSAVLITTVLVIGTGRYLLSASAGSRENVRRHTRWISIWLLRKNVAVFIIISGNLVGALFAGIVRYLKQRISLLYPILSIVNIGIWLGLLFLAFHLDKFFHEDLKHTVEMRMSAAIPCVILGMIWGVIAAHLICTYRVKVKVD